MDFNLPIFCNLNQSSVHVSLWSDKWWTNSWPEQEKWFYGQIAGLAIICMPVGIQIIFLLPTITVWHLCLISYENISEFISISTSYIYVLTLSYICNPVLQKNWSSRWTPSWKGNHHTHACTAHPCKTLFSPMYCSSENMQLNEQYMGENSYKQFKDKKMSSTWVRRCTNQ